MDAIQETVREIKLVRKNIKDIRETLLKTKSYVAILRRENECLRAALKPVLECESYDSKTDGYRVIDEDYVIVEAGADYGIEIALQCADAVREAKRIYNESNNGESHN